MRRLMSSLCYVCRFEMTTSALMSTRRVRKLKIQHSTGDLLRLFVVWFKIGQWALYLFPPFRLGRLKRKMRTRCTYVGSVTVWDQNYGCARLMKVFLLPASLLHTTITWSLDHDVRRPRPILKCKFLRGILPPTPPSASRIPTIPRLIPPRDGANHWIIR